MVRLRPTLLFAIGLAALGASASAQANSAAPRHAHKAKTAKAAASQPTYSGGGLNQPSANFRDAAPPDDGTNGPSGPTSNVRPTIGENGNIGFGTGF